MTFTPIDVASWPRREIFAYFSRMAPTGYSLTVEADVTRLVDTVKQAGQKFFPAYLWLVTGCLNRQPEFRTAVRDGVLGTYDSLTPLYAHFHEDDRTFSFMWTPYDEDYAAFYEAYCRNQAEFGGNHGVLAQPLTPPPPNAYTVSAIPWVRFSSFHVQNFDNKPYFFPSVEAGRITEAEGRKMMPLSITCHHATTDGIHVDRFLKDLDEAIAAFEIV